MTASSHDAAPPERYINRDHSRLQYVFILSSISMCITVDILQYSMPLSFLPSVLEDRGHSPMKIATAIGVYYWTGLLGGIILTSYELWRMLCTKEAHGVDLTPFTTVQRQIKVIIINLGIGVFTLFIQAWSPRLHVHTACRFVQGLVGAFLFFYVFLLNVAVFKGQQQVIAMTFASCATVLAELVGPLVGSILFDNFGQRSVFWFLGVVSFVNQGMLGIVLYTIRPTDEVAHPCQEKLCEPNPEEGASVPIEQTEQRWGFLTPQPGAWRKLKALVQDPTMICATLIITMAGVIKGSVEEMLPFHADHQWGYDPMQIGKLFCTTAIAYFVASALVAHTWISLGRFQLAFSSQCILLLGLTSWMSFHVAYYYKDEVALFATFGGYGFSAGLTFTAAAQLIANVVDKQEGHAKDAANGIWNTMWELGGSTGFFLGGFLAHHYKDQMMLITRFMIASVVTSICIMIAGRGGGVYVAKAAEKPDKALNYGSTA